MSEEILEKLAELEHMQWMQWAKNLLEKEPMLSLERLRRWQALMVPYTQLPEEQKEQNRIWARKVLHIIEDSRR